MNDIEGRLQAAGRAFLAAAWLRLRQERVVPPPAFHPYMEVGRDYFGDSVMVLAEYQALEDAIAAAHPRFGADLPLGERESPSGLIFSFLETFIARLTSAHEEFSPDGPPPSNRYTTWSRQSRRTRSRSRAAGWFPT
ncbi:hypothetical protein OG462_04880 [Streptomyces sp. NBC_01077]|uniref:hypothetical protein n=1 Tax=Streptomyces sp. NBC_01077 TaxID=2903746 RepID=UPI00386E90F0|nr:hypothetical protein OG462_04880 [Streptomyces sp. NBC_01077]